VQRTREINGISNLEIKLQKTILVYLKKNERFKIQFTRLTTAGFVHLQVGLTVQSQGALCPAQGVGGHTVISPDVGAPETTDHQPHVHFVGRSVLTDRIFGPAEKEEQ
jgi:hypothetical protein